jgi:cardiolipin synthase
VIIVILHITCVGLCILRILLRRNRQPESRLTWLVIVLVLPIIGIFAYCLLGETNIGRKRAGRLAQVFDRLPRPEESLDVAQIVEPSEIDGRFKALFRVGQAVSGYKPVSCNRANLLASTDATIESIVADIGAAKQNVHIMFYIWLTDHNGMEVVEALKNAAARGVVCRVMVDDLGSRAMIKSQAWQDLIVAGVYVARALKIGNPLLRIFNGRIDLRNHRKIVVIDNFITYCGSQNCADAAFLPKHKYAPWVDSVMRFEGPVARQNQHLFASDWMACVNEDISDLLLQPMPNAVPGFIAQVIGTGPTIRNSAMPEMFQTLMYAAQHEIIITTPYYVPNAALQAALCGAANRGVDTTIIFPKLNDDFAVGATAKSYYEELLTAGVKIFEFRHGILHAKTMTIDSEVTLIGSANMDRRSFDLNYENNILLHDRVTTINMRTRQFEFVANSDAVSFDDVYSWNWRQRILNNSMAILGPVL